MRMPRSKIFWFCLALIIAFIIIRATGSWGASYNTILLSDGSRDWSQIDKFVEKLKPEVNLVIQERRRINFHPGIFKPVDLRTARELYYALEGEEYDLAIVFSYWGAWDWVKVISQMNWLATANKGKRIIILKFLSKGIFLHELGHIYPTVDGWEEIILPNPMKH